jgi:hypothetical protein
VITPNTPIQPHTLAPLVQAANEKREEIAMRSMLKAALDASPLARIVNGVIVDPQNASPQIRAMSRREQPRDLYHNDPAMYERKRRPYR